MSDAALGVPPNSGDTDSWRDGLRQWATGHRQVYLRRPWLARVPVTGPPSGPNQIGWMDSALSALRDTGLDWAAKVGVISLVSGYVRHSAVLSQELSDGREELSQASAEREYGRALVRLVDPARFPEAAELFASPVFETPPGDESTEDSDFTFGLEVILDGVAEAVRRTDHR